MLFRFTRFFVAAWLLAAVWLFVATRPAGRQVPLRARNAAPGPVKILQFYANVGALTRGEKALLCYGVENAKAVEIKPMAEAVSPSPNRCIQIGPQHTTHYTLMAEGFDGRMTTQSLTLPVYAAPPPPPRVLHFAGIARDDRTVELCYQVANAEHVSVHPPEAADTRELSGCFAVSPSSTTTYTLTAHGSGRRKASKQVIVEVGG